MKDYLSIDEAILITQNKIQGSIFETLGAEKFLQKALDKVEINPVYRFSGYIVTQPQVDNDFYSKNDNIQNIWWVNGYFRDDHSLYVRNHVFFKNHKHNLQSAFRNLSNNRFILKYNAGDILKLVDSKYLGNYDAMTLNRVDSEGKIYLTGCQAIMFNSMPVYEGTFGHEYLKDTIIIDRDDVYIDINELSEVLLLEPSAYDLTPNQPKATKKLNVDNKANQSNKLDHDEPTHHKTINSMATLIATLLKLASYDKQDLENPHGNINREIIAKAEGLGLTLGKDFIAKWLTKADDVL